MALSLMLFPVVLAVVELPASSATNDVQQQYERWERRLRARIIEHHVVSASANKDPPCEVVISFAIGQNERPTDANIQRTSCGPFQDRAARRLVRQLVRIGPVPSMAGKDHRVVLKLIYGKAPTAAADRDLTDALEIELQAHSRRNLEIVTMSARR